MFRSFLRSATASSLALLGLFLGSGCVSRAAQPTAATFDRIGNAALATGKAPGFSFAVVRDGTIVYMKGFGRADIARDAVDPQTRFAVGSITKQFTAAAILLLAQRGKLALDDPLSTFLPAFPNASLVTLRMLLNQTSG